jgi:hypothetical protein
MIPVDVVLNDGETYTGVRGTFVIDSHGMAFDLEQILMGTPHAVIRGACRGMAKDVVPKYIDYVDEEMWP